MKKKLFPVLLTASFLLGGIVNSQYSAAQPAGGFGGFQMPEVKLETSQQWKDVNYAGDDQAYHTCDIYLPKVERESYPVVIHIYGSAWFSNNSKGAADLGTIVKALLDAGYAVVCPNHRSSMDAKWPAQLHDIKAVVRFVRGEAKKYKFNPRFIATSGFSSGGHLSSTTATTSGTKQTKVGTVDIDLEGNLGNFTNESSIVNAACDWSGPIDLTAMDCGDHMQMGDNSPEDVLLASKLDKEPDKYRSLSATTYVDKNDPPVIIFHGEKDNVVPCCQGRKFFETLKAAGVKTEATFVPEGGHGMGMYAEENLKKMVRFLDDARRNSDLRQDSLLLQSAIREETQVNLPLFQTKYTADPSPLVVGDTLFLYTSHDASPEDIPDENEKSSAGFFMYDWLLWSTTDMVNWTEHGAVASLKDFPWRSRENGAWAIQTVKRNGKYYLYAPLHGHGIGVLVSDSPYGPFRDPLGEPIVWQKEHWNDIDPSVFTDDDGQAYLYWGNPHCYYALLNDDMISLKSGITQLPHIDHYQEGPWFYKRNGKYYLGFASTCCPEGLGYAMSDSPTGPWTSTGYIMRPTQRDRGNHPGIADFKGHTYIFGQDYDLMHIETFTHHERRSVSAAEMKYNADGTIEEVPYWLDLKPLEQLQWLNPYQRVEAETMNWGYGLKTAKMGIKNTGVVNDMPESTGKRNMYVFNLADGKYIKLRGVDFGKGAKEFAITAASMGNCNITLRLDGQNGPVVGTVNIKDTGNVESYKSFTTKLDAKTVTGVHDFYLCFDNVKGDVRLDWWTCSGIK